MKHFVSLWLIGMIASDAAHAEPIEMLVFSTPGLFDVDAKGNIGGPGGETLKKIVEVSGLDIKYRVMPFARVQYTVADDPSTCAAGMPRLPGLKDKVEWLGLLTSTALMLYGRPDETRRWIQLRT